MIPQLRCHEDRALPSLGKHELWPNVQKFIVPSMFFKNTRSYTY